MAVSSSVCPGQQDCWAAELWCLFWASQERQKLIAKRTAEGDRELAKLFFSQSLPQLPLPCEAWLEGSKSSFNYGIGRFGCLLSTSTCKVPSVTCLFGGCSCKISGFWSHSCLHRCQCREARMVWMKPKGASLLISYPEMTGRSELVSLHLPKSPLFPIPPPALGTQKPPMPEANQS